MRLLTQVIFGLIAVSIAVLSVGAAKKKSPSSLWRDVELHKVPAGAKRELRSFLFDEELLSPHMRGTGTPVNPDVKRKDRNKLSEEETDRYAIQFVQDVVEVIYKKQNPPKEQCRSRRLLAVQMSSTSFEGTGSLLKQAMLSLAIAMHSNRTAIWGLGYPFLFEHSKEVWDSEDNEEIPINDEVLNCSQDDPAAGAYGCFFEPLSTCALEDVSAKEMIVFSENPHNDTARIALSEIRRGVANYHPPIGLFEYIWSQRHYPESLKQEFVARQAHIWGAAVAAYVFRLKPALVMSFRKKFDHIFAGQDSVWGMHIRHGDLKALSNVYAYKEIFDFEDYFHGALALSQKQQFAPSRLFVATDSVQADQLPKIYAEFMDEQRRRVSKRLRSSESETCESDDDDECDADEEERANKSSSKKNKNKKKKNKSRDEDDDDDEDYDEEEEEDEEDDEDDEDEDEEEDEDDEEDDEIFGKSTTKSLKSTNLWFGDSVPDLVTINNSARYRTEHGSHTVAANGGCLRDENYSQKGMRCALNYEAIVHYQTIDEHRGVPRSVRLMRVLLESIEDMYLLARCDAMVAQGSSHFSTLASLLVWARTGAKQFENSIEFLDITTIEQGFTPTAFLHGMNLLNGTHGIDSSDVKNGQQRWIVHTNAFISGLPVQSSGRKDEVKLKFDPWSPESRIRLVKGLPQIDEQLFYLEAKMWLGGKYKPTLPGLCPARIPKGENLVTYIASNINLGVDHLQASHYGQALRCWFDAMQVLRENKDVFDPKQYEEYYSVAKDNAATMRLMRYAEFVVNENQNSKDFFKYNDKYMKKPYDGVTGSRRQRAFSSEKSGDDKKLVSLEDVNDEIAQLEIKLKKLKAMRDKLIAAHYSFMSGNLGKMQ